MHNFSQFNIKFKTLSSQVLSTRYFFALASAFLKLFQKGFETNF